MANNGGVPVKADLSKVTDPKNKELIENFDAITKSDGLAFYPDWPWSRSTCAARCTRPPPRPSARARPPAASARCCAITAAPS